MAAPSAKSGPDLFGAISYLLYVGIGGLLVFGFAWALQGAVETQKDSVCRALAPEMRTHVSGTVKLADGGAATGASITAQMGDDVTGEAKVGEGGQYELFLPAGRHTFFVLPVGQDEPAQGTITTEAAQSVTADITLDGTVANIDVAQRSEWIVPDLELQDLQGNPVKLSDFRGKLVVLNFWATYCEPCITEWPQLHRLAERLGDSEDVEIIAVSIDEKPDPIEPFLGTMALGDSGVTVLWDPTQSLQKQLGTSNIPDTYFIDEQGRVLQAFVNVRKWGAPEAFHCVDGTAS